MDLTWPAPQKTNSSSSSPTSNKSSKETQNTFQNIHPETLNRKRLEKMDPIYGHKTEYYRTGLKNMGNTCYVNVILQCLTSNKRLLEILLKKVPYATFKTEKT